jgi:hypothetical protein
MIGAYSFAASTLELLCWHQRTMCLPGKKLGPTYLPNWLYTTVNRNAAHVTHAMGI